MWLGSVLGTGDPGGGLGINIWPTFSWEQSLGPVTHPGHVETLDGAHPLLTLMGIFQE